MSYPLSFGTVPFGSARLHWNRTERFQTEPFLQRAQNSRDSGSKSSSVNARPIRTKFGSVLFGSSVNGVLEMRGSVTSQNSFHPSNHSGQCQAKST